MKRKMKVRFGIILALLSAFLYAFNFIIEKKYITETDSFSILFLMYLGAGIGLFIIHLISKKRKKKKKDLKNRLTKKEVPFVLLIVICELAASFLTIEAVKIVDASLVSLLSVFEIIATAFFAFLITKKPMAKNELLSTILMIIGFIILNFKSGILSNVGLGSLLVIGGCIFWGIENNITALISAKEPAFFTSIKCTSVALFYLVFALLSNGIDLYHPILLILGFFTYGLGILFYTLSTKYLNANKTTIIFSFMPMFGVILAVFIYKELLTPTFMISFVFMLCAILCINVGIEEE